MQLYYVSKNGVVQYCGGRRIGFFSADSLSTREDFNQTMYKLQWNLLE